MNCLLNELPANRKSTNEIFLCEQLAHCFKSMNRYFLSYCFRFIHFILKQKVKKNVFCSIKKSDFYRFLSFTIQNYRDFIQFKVSIVNDTSLTNKKNRRKFQAVQRKYQPFLFFVAL